MNDRVNKCFAVIFYNIIKVSFDWTVYAATLTIQSLQLSPFSVFSPYYLEPFIHSFPLLFCLSQFSTSLLKSMMNINYVLIYKTAPSLPLIFLWVVFPLHCLFWFPIILCEAKSRSPLCSSYLLTSSLCSQLPLLSLCFNHFFSLSSNCLWSYLSLYTGSI